MTQHNAIKLFETKKVRTIWDDKEEKWGFYYCMLCMPHKNITNITLNSEIKHISL